MRTSVAVILLSCALAHGATVRDRAGDFARSDVVAVQVGTRGRAVVITITYGSDVIGMATGAGGTFCIDSDRNPATGAENTKGFDCAITFNVTKFAPTAQLDISTGALAGQTVQIGAQHGNGTQLSFTPRSVTFVVPLQYVGGTGDFDFVLYATGQFSTGSDYDRVPDRGTANAKTGRVTAAPAPRGVASRIVQALPTDWHVASISTSVEDGNAVWVIDTRVDLPVGPLDLNATVHYALYVDSDRRLATGISGVDVPFLPFGPDRRITCVLAPSRAASTEVMVGVGPNGERVHAGGGAGTNDLHLGFERRRARLVVPFSVLGVQSAAFNWLLIVTQPTGRRPPEVFRGAAVQFDTGNIVAPLTMPAGARVVDDPIDAKMVVDIGKGKTVGVPIDRVANIELRRLQAVLTPRYLLARITYQTAIVARAANVTSVSVQLPGTFGLPVERLLSVNWHAMLGGQAILHAPFSATAEQTMTPLNQCIAKRGGDAFLLLPAEAFGLKAFRTAELVLSTRNVDHRLVASVPQGRKPRNRETEKRDRLPDTGAVRLTVP